MRITEPYIELIAKTTIIPEAIDRWLQALGVERSYIDMILDKNKTAAEMLVEVAGRRCYLSFQPGLNPNVSRIRQDVVAYIDNILSSRHGSVAEHVSFTFAIENVSRVFTGEWNRHRVGTAISEGSMRYIRYEDIPYWIPTSFQGDETHFSCSRCGHGFYEHKKGEPTPEEIKLAEEAGIKILSLPELQNGVRLQCEQLACTCPNYLAPNASKEAASRDVMERVFEFVEKQYKTLQEIWKEELSPKSKFSAKKMITSAMRRIIPMGVSSGGVWSLNLRALRHVFEMRCSPAAEEEILLIATLMLNLMRKLEPAFFSDFSTDELGFSSPKYHKV